jgi:hypothetical protein
MIVTVIYGSKRIIISQRQFSYRNCFPRALVSSLITIREPLLNFIFRRVSTISKHRLISELALLDATLRGGCKRILIYRPGHASRQTEDEKVSFRVSRY